MRPKRSLLLLACHVMLLTARDLREVISVKNFDVGPPKTHRFQLVKSFTLLRSSGK